MTKYRTHSAFLRTVCTAVITSLICTSLPVQDLVAAATEQQTVDQQKRPQQNVAANRTAPQVAPVSAFPVFTSNPVDDELFGARVFEEPLVPMGGSTSAEENRALSQALLSYLKAGMSEDVSVLERFLAARPESPWRVSLLTNMGIVYRRTGYFTKALRAWADAWTFGKNESLPMARAIADRAVAELAELQARLGHSDALEPLLQEIASRDLGGSVAEKIREARQALWQMHNHPDEAFRCGVLALERILASTRDTYDGMKILRARSTLQGMSLSQVLELGQSLDMNLQMARRTGRADVPVPSVVHWKVGHYAALVRENNGRYLVQDPALGDEFWISRTALNEEASGYFLVPSGTLPPDWQTVSLEEGAGVWGKGNTTQDDRQGITPYDEKVRYCLPSQPMADYNIHAMLVNLNITDTPVRYRAPRGPDVQFVVTYNHRDAFQPSVFTYSNLGPLWTFDWLSYIKDDPSDPAGTATLYVRGGGEETFTSFNASTQSYTPQFMTQTILTRTSASPVRYERRLADGSVEVFAQADGASTFPRRIFMTEWRDATGNALTFTYDASLRLVAVTDAIGQVTTLSYELASDPLKITKVTDPFGRLATFEYTATGRLSRITDIIGIRSEFAYGEADFITSLTTPYGQTAFLYQEEGRRRWLEATDATGATERVEFLHQAPGIPFSDSVAPTGLQLINMGLYWRNSFHWDKRALALYPGDYTKATIYHWLHAVDGSTSRLLESMKKPLESRIWYDYPGQMQGNDTGAGSQPIAIGRVLDDNSSQVWRYEYNAIGKITKTTDPLGRETVFVYGTNNVADPDPATGTSVDLLEIRQKNGAGNDVLETTAYNAQHQPLTVTDATGQTTTFSYRATGDPRPPSHRHAAA